MTCLKLNRSLLWPIGMTKESWKRVLEEKAQVPQYEKKNGKM